ncbi:RelB [Lentilactobacillus sp. IMAU92037]|uniref:RelB n=1 Tax=Lentilactobacillus TaxID=2767893 RepID=UPI001C2C70F6|nr:MULTISPECIES: RelB [Lentilactobacillus]MBV0930302.1 RelB [Lentilactobacillus dabitei]MDM7515350.1 RelB [Lentilactobacillus sp. TOM.63]
MSKMKQKVDRISVRISPVVKKKAQERLEEVGLNLSDYVQYALANIAEGENDYLNSPSALEAKYEVEHGQAKTIGDGSAKDFKKYIKDLESEVADGHDRETE